jgi:metallophosphoesterase (TIGR00282 family)
MVMGEAEYMAFYRAMMLGDVVGDPGLAALEEGLPGLIKKNAPDFVVVNGENAAGGFGMTGDSLMRILAAGADVVTSGNHVWEKKEFWPFLESEARLLRPANYPAGSPGRGWGLVKPAPGSSGEGAGAGKPPVSWLVVNLQGRELMQGIDCPFRCFDAIRELPDFNGPERPLVIVDFHAESSEEKEALAYYLDGRVSLLAGTHTHIQTADERILPQGSAYITDLGMTGVADSVIGMDSEICVNRVRLQVLYRMECAKGSGVINGILAEIDGETGKAVSIKRL